MQPHQLVSLGLQVASIVSRAPLQAEFRSWSCDAREALLDTVTSVLATAAAMSSTSATVGTVFEKQLSTKVVDLATNAIQRCLVLVAEPRVLRESSSRDDQDDDDDDDMDNSKSEILVKRHQAALDILRGLYPNLVLKDVLPNGENGKIAAAAAASTALEGMVQAIAQMNLVQSDPMQEEETPVTPATTRRRRRSSLRGSTRKRKSLLTPAKLKSSVKTPRTGSSVIVSLQSTKTRPVLTAIVGLLQKLAADQANEKVVVRHPTVDTICKCLGHLPVTERSIYLDFLRQLVHSKISLNRLVGSELLGRLLSEEWLWQDHVDVMVDDDNEGLSPGQNSPDSVSVLPQAKSLPEALLAVQLSRLQDRVPSIRAATATALGDLLRRLTPNSSLAQVLEKEGDNILDMLRMRARDEKATVRRGAVETLVELLMMEAVATETETHDRTLLRELCGDESVMVRRAAAEALTRWMEHASGLELMELEKVWCGSVLNLVLDSETSCVSKGVTLVENTILLPILQDEEAETAWRILDLVARDSSGQVDALRKALAQLAVPSSTSAITMKGLLKKIHSICVETLQGEDLFEPALEAQRNGVWCLFEALMSFSPNKNEVARAVKKSRIDLDFVATSWETMLDLSSSATASSTSKTQLLGSIKKSLHVLAKLASCVDSSLAMESSTKLLGLLKDIYFSPELIGTVVEAIVSTTIASADGIEDAQAKCRAWIRDVYATCHDRIANGAGANIRDCNVPQLARAIFTVGELSLVGFSPSDDEKDARKLNQATKDDPLRGLHEKPSSVLVDIVGAFLPHFVPGSDQVKTPESLRAHGFIAFGKLCLRDEKLAKASLNIFARELHENMQQGSWKVQSNALLVLGDLCVRYTNMVDRYLPIMAACMQAGVSDMSGDILNSKPVSGAAYVRKHAVYLLSNLLLQDYIKWRGLLFHRFLVASADEDDDVARFAGNLLCGQLLLKQPKLFANQFVESIFVLNRCTAHPIYVTAVSMGDGGSGISVGFDGINLTGEVGRVRRMEMYELMLSRMSDGEKISVTARITKEVLGSALETGSDLNRVCTTSTDSVPQDSAYTSAATVLSDALEILADPLMRVGKGSPQSSSEDTVEDPNTSTSNPAQKLQAAQGRLLSNISRKHLVENILPVLCNLKVVLQKSRSILLKNLQHFLVYIFRQFRAEVTDFLANDRDLLQEIEYDARQFHKASQSAKKKPPAASSEFTITPVAMLDGFEDEA